MQIYASDPPSPFGPRRLTPRLFGPLVVLLIDANRCKSLLIAAKSFPVASRCFSLLPAAFPLLPAAFRLKKMQIYASEPPLFPAASPVSVSPR